MFRLFFQMAQLVYRYAGWWVGPIAVLLLFPSQLTALGFIGAGILFVCRWLACGSPLPLSRAAIPVFILSAMTFIGFVISSDRDVSIATAAQLVASVSIFVVLFDNTHTSADLWQAAVGLVILGILFSFVAPFTTNWSPNKVFGVPLFYDTIWPRLPKMTNSNILAGALAPIIPISFALTVQRERRWRALGAISLAPMFIILILLQSRGALFALGVGIVIWVTLYWRWVLPLIPLGLLAVLVINQMAGGPTVAQLIYGIPGTGSDGTFVERQDLWAQAFYLIRQSPFTGIGLNIYSVVGSTSFPHTPEQPGLVVPHVHNLFLQVALDTGIVGLAAFAVLMGSAISAAWLAYRKPIEKHLAIGLLSAFSILLAHGFGDVVVWGTAKSSVVLWILLGITFAFDKVRKTV